MTIAYGLGNPCPGLGQAQQCEVCLQIAPCPFCCCFHVTID